MFSKKVNVNTTNTDRDYISDAPINYDNIFGKGNSPTEEQLLIGRDYLEGKDLAVSAASGSSKTTTAIYLATSDQSRSILYLAFNKSIVEDVGGRMPDNVNIKTIHSLAYSAEGYKYRDKLSRPRGKYVNVAGTVSEVVLFYKIKPLGKGSVSETRISRLVRETVTIFESSADEVLSKKHIPSSVVKTLSEQSTKDGKEFVSVSDINKAVYKYASKLWADRIDLKSRVLTTHNTYLKLYQLSKPILPYDVVIVDEVQDVQEVFLDIFINQKCQRVMVGDPQQAIYQWNYCVDGFKHPDVRKVFTSRKLSQSFRFGEAIAKVGRDILKLYTKKELTGFGDDSIVGKVDQSKPFAKLYRTNGLLLTEAVDFIEDGMSVNIGVDVKDFIKRLEAISTLQEGKKPKHQDIAIYKTFEDLELEAKDDVVLARDLKLVISGRAFAIIDVLGKYTKPKDYQITLSTSHKSKGLEYDQVILAEDYRSFLNDEGKVKYPINEGEVNLLYVSATRAKKVLQLNGVVEEVLRLPTIKGLADRAVSESQMCHQDEVQEETIEDLLTSEIDEYYEDGRVRVDDTIYDSTLELLQVESSHIPWWCPVNEEWMNRFSESKEFSLRESFIKIGRLCDYEEGLVDLPKK